jgi:DNA-binding GntR family transcriptional regulator
MATRILWICREFDPSQSVFAVRTEKFRIHAASPSVGPSLVNNPAPIREAIRRLASDGLIEVGPFRGMMITELSKQQVRELYALRTVLEGAAAGMAAQHASPSELADMRGMIERMNSASKNPAEVARMNWLFHATIHEAAHNHYLAQALSQLSDSLALLPRTTFEVRSRTEEARKEHLAMLEAIERRAPEEADRLARKHIENAGAARIQMMFEAV